MNEQYIHLQSREQLMHYFDDICIAARTLVTKNAGHGHTAETIIQLMLTTTGRPDGFLCVIADENGKFEGFIFAIVVPSTPPWIDFIGLVMPPGRGVKIKHEAFKVVKDWARSVGATKIIAGVTRSPLRFFDFFYKPLGFENIGLIIEFNLEKEK